MLAQIGEKRLCSKKGQVLIRTHYLSQRKLLSGQKDQSPLYNWV